MPIGAAIGGAVATTAGSAISASSQKKAANKAADAQSQAAADNNALQRDIYGQNKTALTPFMDRGNTAGNYLNAFLGLPTGAAASTTGGAAGAPDYAAYVQANPDLQADFNKVSGNFGGDIAKFGQYHWQNYGQNEGRQLSPTSSAAVTNPSVTMGQADSAFGNYISNSDYGFQFATGANQVNSGYAGTGALQSGSAMKALEKYRQNLQAGYRNEYTGQLAQQSAQGLGAASALAGVGQNYAGAVGANNQNAADGRSNAALIAGQNNPLGNVLGTLGGLGTSGAFG
jgi:hypothetical protein